MGKVHTRAKRKRGQSTGLHHSRKQRKFNGHRTWHTKEAARRWAENNGFENPTITKHAKKYRIKERDRTPYKTDVVSS